MEIPTAPLSRQLRPRVPRLAIVLALTLVVAAADLASAAAAAAGAATPAPPAGRRGALPGNAAAPARPVGPGAAPSCAREVVRPTRGGNGWHRVQYGLEEIYCDAEPSRI